MSDLLTLRLFGKPHVARGSKPVTGFISTKAQALLFYLAVTGRPHSREALSALFWDEMPEAQASKNLRNVLSNLRTLVGSNLLIARDEVEFDRDSAYWLDVGIFLATLGSEPGKPDLVTLHNAVELYQGEFLEGFSAGDALPFEEWMLGRRSLLNGLITQALQTLVVKHLEREEHAAGIDYANRLLAIEPWREETHRHLMILLARSRQRAAALAQFETCREILARELDVEPMPETTALYHRLKAMASPPPHNLPPQPTPFVGRAIELAEVAGYLNDPDAQLLTLVGPGGIGKTRLALQAAARRVDPETNVEMRFADGVFFVPLMAESENAAGEAQPSLLAAIAAALHFDMQGPMPLQAQLLKHLRDKDMLLVLDNFEQVASEARQLADLLHLAPRVKLLVTSRVRLNLQEEWLLEVKGLEVPGTLDVPLEQALTFGALALFLQQARRVNAGFTLTDAQLPHMIRICQLVDGVPLEIELAASWLRVLSCQEIVAELAKGLDFLATTLQNVPPRHRSLRAVFAYSWDLLAAEEQMVLRQLAVFRGGFQREAATTVAGASLPMLAGLVDKSLLQRDSAGRYQIHDLLRQYADEKREALPTEDEHVRDAHCRYYAQLLAQHQAQLKGDDLSAALSELNVERENVRAAWDWAVRQRRVAEVNLFMECL